MEYSSLFADPSSRKAIHCLPDSGHQPLISASFQYSLNTVISKILDSRYYGRQTHFTFLDILRGFVFHYVVFRSRLGGLTVAIGVMFARRRHYLFLAEVIASVQLDLRFQSWWLLQPGDRVQIRRQ